MPDPAAAVGSSAPHALMSPTPAQVVSIVSDTELKVTALNGKKLGQRKNCNLPGEDVGERARA
jgi:hypothetical protein